jgi:hypothetical protein
METRYLYVVLTRTTSWLSNLIHLITGDEFTHSALGFDRGLRDLYSFCRRYTRNPFWGCFKKEYLNEGLYALCDELPGVVIELPVTREQYDAAEKTVAELWAVRSTLGYNYLGLFRHLFGLYGAEDGRRFLCAEFVYHVLRRLGAAAFGVPRDRIKPQDLTRIGGEVIYRGDLKKYCGSSVHDVKKTA